MQELFRAFYPLSDQEKEEAWKEGLIILDTSALLNLYRYPLAARDRLLTVLERLQDRLWLPHQAALEYQRNQPAVRFDQITQFRTVRDEIGALKAEFNNRIDKLQLRKRHALIDAEPLREKVAAAVDSFQDELNQIERDQAERYQEGYLQLKIEALFSGRIGQTPTQDFLDAVYKDGEKRYASKIPPGYQDSQKSDPSKEPPEFSFGGLTFQRRFGDLILWREILQKVKKEEIRWFILVTDDAKEDWWHVVGGQRTGPRPELFDEAVRESGARGFILQTSERFTERASESLGIEVSDEVLQQISRTRDSGSSAPFSFTEKVISSAAEGIRELAQAAEGLHLEISRIREIMQDGTEKLEMAIDFRSRHKVADEIAFQINESAARFEELVVDFEASLKRVEPVVDLLTSRTYDLPVREEILTTKAKETLHGLFKMIASSAQEAQNFDDTLAGISGILMALRVAVQRLRSGVQHYIRTASQVQRWLDHWT